MSHGNHHQQTSSIEEQNVYEFKKSGIGRAFRVFQSPSTQDFGFKLASHDYKFNCYLTGIHDPFIRYVFRTFETAVFLFLSLHMRNSFWRVS